MGSSIDFGGRPIHFIGIGGIGMSGLAYVLARRGLPVS
ncbi:Mur ligase domain-containing protein, partial [Chamaesiphon sp. OTE_8_metabat_110]